MSSHLRFNDNVNSMTDQQLYQMTIDAFNEMDGAMADYGWDPNGLRRTNYMPSVMTVLAAGNDVFLASSQKGRHSFVTGIPDSPVAQALKRCETTARPGPKYEGKCGEMMVTQAYYRLYPSPSGRRGQGARTLSVQKDLRGDVTFVLPCGTNDPKDWGCDRFVIDQDIRVVVGQGRGEDYALSSISGGLASKGQVPLCS
ncbi:Hypothetical protein D9617_14g077930 [Elsinoe fawcettii]|nr:Hypothetical protein D9617_14g077930 [Elsinoe fawcettii]